MSNKRSTAFLSFGGAHVTSLSSSSFTHTRKNGICFSRKAIHYDVAKRKRTISFSNEIMMNSSQNRNSNRDEQEPESLATSSSMKIDEDEVFVMEDEMLSGDLEEDPLIIWNKLPSPTSLFETSYVTDVIIALTIIAIVYGLVLTIGSLFSTTPYAALTIETSLKVLPSYAAQSITRMLAGYTISLIFSLSYAYIAYRVKFAAKILMLVIDVLQSIPLLSFLPGVVLGLIAIFPGARIGVEIAAVLLLFTSMAWNMLLGFYQSLCGIPSDLVDVAQTFRLSDWKRFWTLELPAGAIGLVWNSVISVAGGWFFLISIESFELGNKDFKLPGLGSYLAVAAENANYSAIFAGLLTIIAIIVVIDFAVWQPLIAWSTKFKYGVSTQREDSRPRSIVLNAIQRSPLFRSIHSKLLAPTWESFVNISFSNPLTEEPIRPQQSNWKKNEENSTEKILEANTIGFVVDALKLIRQIFSKVLGVTRPVIETILPGAILTSIGLGIGYGVWQAIHLVDAIPLDIWISLGTAAMATFGRVVAALILSLLWAVPVGVAIGRNPKLSALLQPIVQIAASVPATALFPFVLLFLARLGGGLEIGSVALMMLGTMWYVLFNVIAGTQAIPNELFEVDSMYNKQGAFQRWRSLILPGIFPYLITGIVTAVGGAWNASIVSEYVVFQGGIMKTHGLGALISEAAASGNYSVLLAATVIMSLLVLLTNRFVWGPLYRLAETKYRI